MAKSSVRAAVMPSAIPAPPLAAVGRQRQEAVFHHVVSACDALVLAVSFCLAYLVRNVMAPGALAPLYDYLWVIAVAIPIWVGLADAMSLTSSPTYRSLRLTLLETARVQTIASLMLLSGLYLLKAVAVSRLLIQAFVIVSVVGLLLERVCIYLLIVRLERVWNGPVRRVLVIGTLADAERLRRLYRQRPHWRADVAGVVTEGPVVVPAPDGVPVLGWIHDLGQLLDGMVVDEIVMADSRIEQRYGAAVARASLDRGLTYHTLIRMPVSRHARHHAEALGDGVYLVSLETTPQSFWALSAKRCIDVVGAVIGLVLCGLALLALAPLIKLDSSGPVLFGQIRVGRNGRRFTMYKFRTMSRDAEAQKSALLASNEMRGPLFKLRDDPRVTRIGRFLRRAYLDELPQCWNVLRGDMSLVGTRPPTPDEVDEYMPHHRRRLSMRPGMTGLWQLSGNGVVTDFEHVVRLDCEYIDRWSIWLDFKVLLLTSVVLLRRAGR